MKNNYQYKNYYNYNVVDSINKIVTKSSTEYINIKSTQYKRVRRQIVSAALSNAPSPLTVEQ